MKISDAKMSAGKLLKIAWAQVILVFILGVGLIYLPTEKYRWLEPLHHIEIGLVVAAAVTSFWHLREFSEFFEKFSSAVLIKDEYLSKLSPQSLTDLRSKAARAILEFHVDNPNYKHTELGEWIDRVLFEDLLPGRAPLSGVYRKHHKEDISLQFLTLEEALNGVDASTSGVPQDDLQSKVIKIISISRFTVISPKVGSADYSFYKAGYSGRTD
jgi:hypothetical protein